MARVPTLAQVGSVRPDIDRSGAARERPALRNAARAQEAKNRAAAAALGAAIDLAGTLRKERQEAEDRAFENNVASQARKRLPEFLFGEGPLKKMPFDPDVFRQPLGPRLDELSEALIDEGLRNGGRASPAAVEATRARLKKLQASALARAAVFENNARVEEMTRDLERNLGDLARQAFDDPSSLAELLGEADVLAAGAEPLLPAEALAARREAARKAITEASVKGLFEQDPALARDMLEAGDFDAGLQAGRKAALLDGARTAIRLEQESAARELAADRRELKRDADAALAKLRGGQAVADLAALESRAEALEESDTRAALSHAEDDRIFMRGFAQRPPAEQADLIAALEKGPELKPVETRRLAAMKAQAAVTERQLARDPLAYAQSSGVIGEPADLTDLSPDALRARLRQAETVKEQFGLTTLPLLRPGEAEALAKEIAEGGAEEAQSKIARLGDLPKEAQASILEKIGSASAPVGRQVLQDLADAEPEEALALLANLDPAVVAAMGFDAGAFVAEQRFRGSLDEGSILDQARDLLAHGQRTFPQIHRGLVKLGIDPAKLGVDVSPEEAKGIRVRLMPDGELIATKIATGDKLGSLGRSRDFAGSGEAQKRRSKHRQAGSEDMLSSLRPSTRLPVSTIFDTAQTEKELNDAERRAINLRGSEPGIRNAPPEPIQISPLEAVQDAISGESRREFDLPELPPNIFVRNEDGELEITAISAEIALARGNPLGQAAIFLSRVPEATVEFDKFGNPFAIYPSGRRFYLNKPGLSLQDFERMAVEGTSLGLGGRLGAGALPKVGGRALKGVVGRLIGAGAGTAGASVGISAAARLKGSEQPFEALQVFQDVTFGVLDEGSEMVVRAFLRNFFSSPAFVDPKTGAVTALGEETLRGANIDPDFVTKELIEDLKRRPQESLGTSSRSKK